MNSFHEQFLQDFHRRFPSCTSTCFSLGFTNQGLTSYDLLLESFEGYEGPLLDLACGDGYLLTLLANKRKSNELLYGLDMSDGELEVAWTQRALIPQHILKGNARALPFAPESMQGISCHMALMLMSEVHEVIHEIHRTLQPHGKFSAIIPAEPIGDQARQIYQEWLKQNMDLESLDSLKQLGDKRVSTGEELKKLFANFKDFQLDTYEIIYELSPEEMTHFFSQFYASGFMNQDKQKKLKQDLLRSYQELGQKRLNHTFRIYHLKATK